MWASLFSAMTMLLPVMSARGEIQNDAIGFSTNHVFESSQAGEHIDTMTGNMTLTIPIGPRYQLHDGFGYGLTLYYNSRIWEHVCPVNEFDYCPGELLGSQSYGLGVSFWPARIYHKAGDKSYAYRLVLEDGSEHFFCDGHLSEDNCQGNYTIDQSRMWIGAEASGAWTVYPGDGRKIILGHVIGGEDEVALVSRIESIRRKPDGTATQWVNFNYRSALSDQFDTITDSQNRTIQFRYGGDEVAIDFPGFAATESPSGTAPPSTYKLHLASLYVHDPSDYEEGHHHVFPTTVLSSVEYPGLGSGEKYQFNYDRDTSQPRGWMLRRTLPTGAVSDYYYHEYSTSPKKPRHTELYLKTLTSGTQTYRWSWTRFQGSLYTEVGGGEEIFYQGSNPNYVRMLDPFSNLTTSRFGYTIYSNDNFVCPGGECANNWYDGLLLETRSYVGPQPDDNRLARSADYTWDLDKVGSTPKMFQYRAPRVSWPTPKPTANSVAVNTKQTEQLSVTPAGGNYPGHSSTTKSSDYVGTQPRRQDEYRNGALYRTTITDWAGSFEFRPSHNFVEV
jgi:hypothetical protein